MLKITAEDVNFLVNQYLEETGFKHTAFTFRTEAKISESVLNKPNIPPGLLLMYLEKGLLLLQMETHLDKDDEMITCGQPMTLIAPHVCGCTRTNTNQVQDDPLRQMEDVPKVTEERTKPKEGEDRKRSSLKLDETKGIRLLTEHNGMVYNLAWHPNKRLLVSGGGDNAARLWLIELPESGPARIKQAKVLHHENPSSDQRQIDITCLDWRGDGGRLVTGGSDGMARVWDESGYPLYLSLGEKVKEFKVNDDLIFAARWNHAGDKLLTVGSTNGTFSVIK